VGYTAISAFLGPGCKTSDILATVVLPGGCPLDCPFCIVNKRDERREQSYITSTHLIYFIRSMLSRGLLGGAAIVGDEPLQKHCWPLAKAFLEEAIDKYLLLLSRTLIICSISLTRFVTLLILKF
jgi:hypothetical protein